MRHTLKAIFGHRSNAQHLKDELLASGNSRADTTLSSMLPIEQADRHAPGVEEPTDDNVGVSICGAGTDNSLNRVAYPPGTEPDALQNRTPADSHYASWVNSGGVSHDAESLPYRYGAEMRSSEKYRNRSWDEAEPSLKSGWETLASDNLSWDASKPAIRCGWDEITPEIDDDSYYRNHWTTRYASSVGDGDYDDYEPAYIYGSEARRSEKYRSRDWRDVEAHLKADWETRHAGRLSSWDNFKDAVKHGWHWISPDMDRKDTD